MSKAFRATIPLVCPNLADCPTEREVLKTYATPFLSEELKTIAEALGAPQRASQETASVVEARSARACT